MRNIQWAIGILIIIAGLALWPVSRSLWQNTIGRSAYFTGQFASKITDSISTLMQLSSLGVKLNETEAENARLKAEIASMETLKSENETLLKEINLSSSGVEGKEKIYARVIGRSPANFLQTFTLDKGSESGVEVGQTVIAEGYLVGQVKSVTASTSEINIISSGQLLLPVVLQESKGTGIVRGGLEGLLVEEIPLEADIKEGELVQTQDLDGVVLSNVSVGTVRSIEQKRGDIFQTVIADSPLDFSEIELVTIIKK